MVTTHFTGIVIRNSPHTQHIQSRLAMNIIDICFAIIVCFVPLLLQRQYPQFSLNIVSHCKLKIPGHAKETLMFL